MQLAVELVLICLLAATLFHALRLERALGVLKRDRSALEDLVSAFNSSTQMAEQGIERLRTTADGAGRQISRQIDRATGLKDDLVFLSDRGERLADRMEALVRVSRLIAQEPASEGPSRTAKPDGPQIAVNERALAVAVDRTMLSGPGAPDDLSPRLRSQAERDLLKALRMPR